VFLPESLLRLIFVRTIDCLLLAVGRGSCVYQYGSLFFLTVVGDRRSFGISVTNLQLRSSGGHFESLIALVAPPPNHRPFHRLVLLADSSPKTPAYTNASPEHHPPCRLYAPQMPWSQTSRPNSASLFPAPTRTYPCCSVRSPCQISHMAESPVFLTRSRPTIVSVSHAVVTLTCTSPYPTHSAAPFSPYHFPPALPPHTSTRFSTYALPAPFWARSRPRT